QSDLEWMSGVSPFNSDEPVWHFHPVVFLEAINDSNYPKTPANNELVPLTFLRFYNGDSIDESDFENAARILECEVAAIKAIAKTETGSSGSYFKFGQKDDYGPAILFGRHHFHLHTNGAYDSQPDISNSHAGGYGIQISSKLFKR
ncbi:N-acetylmuramidase domain-containing protein, partial [Salmonella enterica]